MSYGKVKNWVITILLMIAAFCSCEYYRTSKELDNINSVLQRNPKLKDCFTHPRKMDFMRKGGEYLPDYDAPRTLNDKVAYLLENYFLRSPITKVIGTKYFAKKYVADIVGEEHVVRLLGVWDNPQDIEWDKLPNRFVLKSVRGNFGREVILVTDKSALDIPKTIKKLEKFCKSPGMIGIRKKRIIAEELLEPKGLRDYKFFYSYGRPLVAYCLEMKDGVNTGNGENTDVDLKTFSFYSLPEWKPLPVKAGKHIQNNLPKPKHFEEMLEICTKLSFPFPLIRIDLYEINDRVLVGEITEDASGGKNIMKPVIWDFKLGENIPYVSKEEIEHMIEKDKEICRKYLSEED